jgi:hypothetical protein
LYIGSWLLFCIAYQIVIALPTIATLEREPKNYKQRTNTKNNAKRIKSDNFTRSKNHIINVININFRIQPESSSHFY